MDLECPQPDLTHLSGRKSTFIASASQDGISRESAKNIQTATEQACRFADPDVEQEEWPQQLLAAALARDGEERVIYHLTALAAQAAIALAHESGQDPREALRTITSWMAPVAGGAAPAPFSGLAWRRAIALVLHLLGDRLRTPGKGPVTSEDLAGALLLVRTLSTIAIAGWQLNPQHMRTTWPPHGRTLRLRTRRRAARQSGP